MTNVTRRMVGRTEVNPRTVCPRFRSAKGPILVVRGRRRAGRRVDAARWTGQNDGMELVHKTVWTGIVLLTAAMTLVAGSPHFVCRCPNGQVKPFCLGFTSKTTGCCCDGTCCCSSTPGKSCCCGQSDAPAGPASQESCCLQHRDQQSTESQGTTWQVGRVRCTKTMAQPPVFVSVSPKSPVSDEAFARPFVAAESVLVSAVPMSEGHGHFSWELHLLPPPTDLVIALQRFLI